MSWQRVAAVYSLASIVGGGLTGALVGAVGFVLLALLGAYRSAIPLLLGLITVGYALHELHLITLPHPERQKQVPSRWRNIYHPYRTAALFGLLLGAGFTTFIPTASYHVLGLITVLHGSPLQGILLFAVYGAARAFLLWPFAQRTTDFGILETFTRYMDVTKLMVRQANGFVLAAIGGYWIYAYLSSL